ncbi:WD repeat-containing protein 66-like [Orbicella faveolata]|uniref:WD repeat-containing protein 66-like n=1 Tax=Orbicella faveolata TaxID=48498 RepID=UPI0009E48688|nr:WD repeat-containing protein 66-like [Orbicella faveolata]
MEGDLEQRSGAQSRVSSAASSQVNKEDEADEVKASPTSLNMCWSFGVNKHVPVQNLSNGSRKVAFFICAHVGVMFDWEANKQQLLQGHCNAITCTCVSEDRRWIATADSGKDSMVIIWDSFTTIPVQTIFEAHPSGCAAIAMSPDAKYIATISSTLPQTVSVWDWTINGDMPMCSVVLDDNFGKQTYITFNPEDTNELVSNSESQVVFYYRNDTTLEYVAPPLTDKDFNRSVGQYSQSIFQLQSPRALTATSCGNIVVWEHAGGDLKCNRKAFKIVKLQEKALTVLTTSDNRHYSRTTPEKRNFPASSTLDANPFIVNDFVISTSTANIAHFATDGSELKTSSCSRSIKVVTFYVPVRCNTPEIQEMKVICRLIIMYILRLQVGLQCLPLDGNPHKTMALIAHPEGVSNLICSYDGKYVFTAGGEDCSALMWEINLDALEAAAALGGEGLVPFYGLLEGGRDGELFAELEDYFYYAQIRSQGVDTTDTRQVSTKVPLYTKLIVSEASKDEMRRQDNKLEVAYKEWRMYQIESSFGQDWCKQKKIESRGDVAWLTIVVDDKFAIPALVLGHSIRTFSCHKNMVVLISERVSQGTRKALQSVGWEIRLVEEMDCDWLDAKLGGDRNGKILVYM